MSNKLLVPYGTIGNAQQSNQGTVSSVAGVPVTNPYGLRRWRAALADAFNAEAPIVCIGDSHTFGQNANGSDTSGPGDSGPDSAINYCGQLRSLFGLTYGFPGEGSWIPNPAQEGRIASAGGGSTFSGFGQANAWLRNNWRFTANTQTLTLTVPTGVTRMMVVQANRAGDVSSTWSLNAVGQGAISALTGTGVPLLTYLNVVAGQPVVITGPTGADVILGLGFRTAQTNGVPVHRMGCGGYAQGNMLGGVYNGILGSTNGVNVNSIAAQKAYTQSHYIWAGAKGLVILYWGTNEQSLQLGSAGNNNGVTPAIFATGLQTSLAQIIADGWCALMVGPPPSGSENQTPGAALLTSYWSVMQSIAASTDHCAFISMGDLWGGDNATDKAATAAAGLRNAGDSHPTRAGYGDIARNLHRVLNNLTPVGN